MNIDYNVCHISLCFILLSQQLRMSMRPGPSMARANGPSMAGANGVFGTDIVYHRASLTIPMHPNRACRASA